MVWIYIAIAVFTAFYYFFIKPLSKWRNRGIPEWKPYPLLGNMQDVIMRRASFYDHSITLYNKFPDLKYYGIFLFTQPHIMIRDVDLIKQVMVKHFDHFLDHRHPPDGTITEPLLEKNLIQLNGDLWKEMRSTLSPSFTSSKMKAMFHLISEIAEQCTQYFVEKKESEISIDLKDVFTRFTNDVIASCAFGVKCDSLKERDNDFFEMGRKVTNFSGFQGFKFLIAGFLPKLAKWLKLKAFDKSVSDYFINLIKETVEFREKNSVIRPDMLHLLMEARKGKLKHEEEYSASDKHSFAEVVETTVETKIASAKTEITEIDMAAQAFIFYFAGFETSSTAMCFLATELAINPDVQEKLYQEICEVMENSNNKPTYEAIMRMTYLDMVISESLRKWPAAMMTDRECTKEFQMTVDGNILDIHKGDVLLVPILGIHRDENYFPNPESFDPERFSVENRPNIIPYTYMPFGLGPRACIGSRFALLEIKMVLVYFLHKFEFIPNEKTVVPIQVSKRSLLIQPEGGFHISLKRRLSN